jgi:hypothetical protein
MCCGTVLLLRDGACSVKPGLDPGIPTGTGEACSGCFASAGAGGDGRVKPGHDVRRFDVIPE